MAEISESPKLLEKYTISEIPADMRHGDIRDLFRLWFGVNFTPLALVTGALGPTVYGLDLWWSLGAVLLGNLVGAIVMALHSAQGAVLGVPQMIQSRGQFGLRGSAVPMVIVMLMYVGFLGSMFVVGGQTLALVSSNISVNLGAVITAAVTVAIVIFGYKLIHLFNTIAIPLFGIGIVAFFVFVFFVEDSAAAFSNGGELSVAGFLGMTSVAAIWQIAYSPYVSDYSRYMPSDVAPLKTFMSTWSGTVLGASLVMVAGAFAGSYASDASPLIAVNDITKALAPVVLIIFFLGAVDAAIINLYGPVLVFITLIQTFRSNWTPGASARILLALVWGGLSLFLALFLAEGFLNNYNNFILGLLYVLVPWSVINLVDFYLVKKADYDVASFFDADGGIYGQVRWIGVVSYLVGVAVQVPFMILTFYEGSLVRFLHGVDAAWVVGIVLTFALYYPLAKREMRLSSVT